MLWPGASYAALKPIWRVGVAEVCERAIAVASGTGQATALLRRRLDELRPEVGLVKRIQRLALVLQAMALQYGGTGGHMTRVAGHHAGAAPQRQSSPGMQSQHVSAAVALVSDPSTGIAMHVLKSCHALLDVRILSRVTSSELTQIQLAVVSHEQESAHVRCPAFETDLMIVLALAASPSSF